MTSQSDKPQKDFAWAAKYKEYMDDYVNYRNGASTTKLGLLRTTIANDLKIANNIMVGKDQDDVDRWSNLHAAMTSYYIGSGAGVSELSWAIN